MQYSSGSGARWCWLVFMICLPIAAGRMPTIAADEVGGADLLWQRDDGTFIPLPMESMHIDLEITGFLVRGTLRQVFRNTSDEVIEAVYLFPTPERAVVDQMEMRIGNRRIVAEVQEKQLARKMYERARSSGRKTALVDRRSANLFRSSVANINPGERIEIVLGLVDEARFADGEFHYAFPLIYTPRFAPPGISSATRSPTTAAAVPTVNLRVSMKAGFPVHEPRSPSHPTFFDQDCDAAEVECVGSVIGDRDLVLTWKPRSGKRPHAAWFVEERDGTNYAMLMLVPAAVSTAITALPSETIFVVDVSGSMQGPSIRQVRQALDRALVRLRPQDRFNLIRFNEGFVRYANDFVQADEMGIDDARKWVANLEAGGGTMIYPALADALTLTAESRSHLLQRVVFLTDGAIGDEQQILKRIADDVGKVRLHTLGIGNAPNRHLMRKMAQLGSGITRFVGNGNDVQGKVDHFFSAIDAPLLTDLRLETDSDLIVETYPSPLPDLHAGEPLIIAMRLQDGAVPGELLLHGWGPSGAYLDTVQHQPTIPESGIATRWARTRIESLMDRRYFEPSNETLREEIIEIGLQFNLVTAFTSLVAVEQRPTALGTSSLRTQSAALPLGGTLDPFKQQLALLFGALGIAVVFWLSWTRYPA